MSKWNNCDGEFLRKPEEMKSLYVLKQAASVLPIIKAFLLCPSSYLGSKNLQEKSQ